jgi:hypothetical protein
MSVSYSRTTDVQCSGCQTAFAAEFWLIVDAGERPDLLARCRDGTILSIPCPACAREGKLDAPLLLYRPGAQPTVLFVPAQGTTREEDNQQAGQLVGLLRDRMGDAWDDAWVAEGLQGVSQEMLPAVLSDDPEAAVRQLQEQAAAEAERNMPPVVRAAMEFIQAPDEVAAVTVFERQRALLQPYEAQQVLDEQFRSDDPDTQQRLAERRDLLRRLRGAAPISPQTDSVSEAPRVSRGSQYAFSAHAETGGTATVVNNVSIPGLERRWTRPAPPSLDRDAVPRPVEMAKVKAELADRGGVAITGRAAALAGSLAVQGAPGVGKTTLARLLALELDKEYPDGVIWEDLGPDFTSAEQAQVVLRRWAGYATSFFQLGENFNKLFIFEPAAVRGLLSEHPALLVVLDNVWSLAAIQPLRDALPPGCRLIVTTRSREIAQGLGAGWVEVGLLSQAEALDLFDRRLGWRPTAGWRPASGRRGPARAGAGCGAGCAAPLWGWGSRVAYDGRAPAA